MGVPVERTADWDEKKRKRAQHVVAREARAVREESPARNIPDASVLIESLGDLLRVWELNRAHRTRKRGGGSREDRLRGLFGGSR